MQSCFEEIHDRDSGGFLKKLDEKSDKASKPEVHRKTANGTCQHGVNVINSPIFEIPDNKFSEVNLEETVDLECNLGRSFSQSSFYKKNSYCCGS